MRACLHNLEMFCSRETLIGLIVKQQNDKSSQDELSNWKMSVACLVQGCTGISWPKDELGFLLAFGMRIFQAKFTIED